MKWLLVREEKNILKVSLNRPDVRNAFNPEMIAEITSCFLGAAANKSLKALILEGEGKSFCAGADLGWMKEMVNFSFEQNQKDSEKLFEMFEAIWNCPVPVIGKIHGAAFGGAMGLLACCDYVIADPQTQFCFSEVKLGIAPAVISAFINRKVPAGAARMAMLSGKVLSVTEAEALGLVHSLVPQAEMDQHLTGYLQALKDAGHEAVRETKKLLNEIQNLDWPSQKKKTAQVIAERRTSTEGQEGLKAFLEKREPSWRKGSL